MILNCSYWGGLKLRKLAINDWIYVFPRVIWRDVGRVMRHWNDMDLFGEFLLGGSNAEKWVEHQKKSFLEIILLDSPCITVRYKLLNTSGWIFDACLIGLSHKTAEMNSLPLHTADQLAIARSTKSQTLLCPTNCLQPTPTLVLIR